MPLLIVGAGFVILLILIGKFKLHAFLALLITSFAVGLLSHMNLLDILDSIIKGVGDTMGKVLLILAFGAVIVAIFTLGLRKGNSMDKVMATASSSIGAVSMIVLIIAAGGGFSQVLKDSNVIRTFVPSQIHST
jgi:H+/gluconate symporter-like permease